MWRTCSQRSLHGWMVAMLLCSSWSCVLALGTDDESMAIAAAGAKGSNKTLRPADDRFGDWVRDKKPSSYH